ncbi:hypothetical protein DBT53_002690 [Aerococcus mictus]|jgi:hypothetical protein|uniref:hypothetical protein n=1 Tax=Bacteria TaxID=2 RepID=UPI000DCC2C39|nr:hypothetical protein [Parvibaculum sp.]MDR3497853.1 hypothetical protein [Parvibaculum sp.]RAV90784.1 hypothetical protein DBT53_12260 [Aerococcus mictus]RAV95016.1 hypothetical protein DBT41_15550 [Aerococcus urinae]
MATTHRIAPHAAATGKEFLAGLAVKAERLRAGAAIAAKGFNLAEAVAAGGYAAIAIYSLALIVNFVLAY